MLETLLAVLGGWAVLEAALAELRVLVHPKLAELGGLPLPLVLAVSGRRAIGEREEG